MITCLTDTIDPVTFKYLLSEFNLPSTSSISEFKTAFKNAVYSYQCIGGPNVRNLKKKLGRNPTEQECLQAKHCNWNPCAIDNEGNIQNPVQCEQMCSSSQTHYCAATNPTGALYPIPYPESTCKAGVCSVGNPQQTPEQCAQSFYCTLPCGASIYSCSSAAQCQAVEMCNDAEVQGCLFPFPPNNYLYCDQSQYSFTRIGCISRSIKDADACQKQGGRWMVRAQTPEQCAQKAKQCIQPNGYLYDLMSEAECTKCKGVSKSIYIWRKGELKYGKMQKLQWLPRGMVPVNEWKYDIDMDKLNKIFSRAAKSRFIRALIAEASCRNNKLVHLMTNIFCLCDNYLQLPSVCGSIQRDVFLANQTVFSGITQNPQVDTLQMIIANDTVANQVQISIHQVPNFGVNPSSKRQGSNPTSLVLSETGYRIGKLIGDAIVLSWSQELNKFPICLKKKLLIEPEKGKYPVVDFAKSTNAAYTLWTPAYINITSETDDVLCGIIREPGVYAPCTRMQYSSYVDLGCDGVYKSGNLADSCGVCNGNNTACLGCDGLLWSWKEVDSCGVCGGRNACLVLRDLLLIILPSAIGGAVVLLVIITVVVIVTVCVVKRRRKLKQPEHHEEHHEEMHAMTQANHNEIAAEHHA
jgi:hypothetical protein